MTDYYQILGVSDSAGIEEIKAAFKKLAVQYHPDKNPGDTMMEEKFKEINQAYQVLSNPYQKARYDLMRSYGSSAEAPPPNYHYPPYQQATYQQRRYRRAAPRVDYQENWKATLYAFAFTFVVALIVMSVIGAKNYYDKIKFEERLAYRNQVFQRILTHHKDGNLDSTFYLINSLGLFDEEHEGHMLTFKSKLIDDTKYLGELNFISQNYPEAIYYLELLDKHTEIKELSLKEALADSYRLTAQTDKSIHMLTQLLMRGYKRIQTFVYLAEIYRDEKSDPEQALFYFEKANLAAKEYYESVYGKAYAVILSGNILPEIHFRLYTGLAEIYLILNQPAKAISVTEWNKQVWPDKPENFAIAAESYKRLGNPQKAFDELQRMQ